MAVARAAPPPPLSLGFRCTSRWSWWLLFHGRYVEVLLGLFGLSVDVSVFRILRLFRILQLEHFVSAFTLLDDVWNAVKDTLAATGLLALVLWVGSACLFYLFEKVCIAPWDVFSSEIRSVPAPADTTTSPNAVRLLRSMTPAQGFFSVAMIVCVYDGTMDSIVNLHHRNAAPSAFQLDLARIPEARAV